MSNSSLSLNSEQRAYIKHECEEEDYHGRYDTCLCGYYEFYIDGLGFVALETHCKKVSACPDGMNWCVADTVSVWKESVSEYGYIPGEDEVVCREHFKGLLDSESSEFVRNVVREDIISYYKDNKDEYGKEVDKTLHVTYTTESNANYDYKKVCKEMVGCIKDLKVGCNNCGTDKKYCSVCRKEDSLWSFKNEVVKDLIGDFVDILIDRLH